MISTWINHTQRLMKQPADLFSGCRKIIRNQTLTFGDWDDDLQMQHIGFTKAKTSALMRNYYNQESIDAALQLWEYRRKRGNYGSVGICTYNHFIKSGAGKDRTVDDFEQARGKSRGSIMGPCIQSIMITQLKKGEVALDITYRTTEFFKKFPADLVFVRDQVLPQFKIDPVTTTMYFANVTIHPMYFLTAAPHMTDPIYELEQIRKKDKRFWEWVVKWSARYLVPKYAHGIAKFAQAMRVKEDVERRLPKPMRRDLEKYMNSNHPGYTRSTWEEDNEAD